MKAAISFLVILCILVAATAHAERPNILLVLADDHGYGDLACFGCKNVQTPNFDRFVSKGRKLISQ